MKTNEKYTLFVIGGLLLYALLRGRSRQSHTDYIEQNEKIVSVAPCGWGSGYECKDLAGRW